MTNMIEPHRHNITYRPELDRRDRDSDRDNRPRRNKDDEDEDYDEE